MFKISQNISIQLHILPRNNQHNMSLGKKNKTAFQDSSPTAESSPTSIFVRNIYKIPPTRQRTLVRQALLFGLYTIYFICVHSVLYLGRLGSGASNCPILPHLLLVAVSLATTSQVIASVIPVFRFRFCFVEWTNISQWEILC